MNQIIFLKDRGIYSKNGKYYYYSNNQIINQHDYSRITEIKVPPAWENVWYASNKKSHIQAYGTDSTGKKQYILSDKWIKESTNEKFERIKRFIKKIKAFKRNIHFTTELSKENIIKVLFNLLLDTHMRVGNEIYSVNNSTYGLTTLKKKHLIINDHYYFSFVGKKNIKHDIKLDSKYHAILLLLIKKIRNNDNLFYYYSDNKRVNISSEDLNDYLKDKLGSEFTCKDFRTYSANIIFIDSFLKFRNNNTNPKKIVLECIKYSSVLLGNSKGICKKSYISNNLINYCLDSFGSAISESRESLILKI